MSKRVIERSAHVVTYARLFQVAKWSLRLAKATDEGSTHNCLSALVFLSFTLEAHMNHVGSVRIPGWVSRERDLSRAKRIEAVLAAVGLVPDFTKKPFSSVKELFALRDELAHGRSLTLSDTVEDEGALTDEYPRLRPLWDSKAEPETVSLYLADVRLIVGAIHKAAGLGDDPFSIVGGAGGIVSATP